MQDSRRSGEEEPLLAVGDRVDHFRVTRRIGHGGMGEVYLARDTQLGRRVALKVLRPRSKGDRVAVERFLFEARVTARFNHPHIVTIYSVGQHGAHPYVALEYLQGQNLRERMAERRLSLPESLRVGAAIASALHEAHRHKVLHRDLKPSNVQLPRDGRLRVVDFGVATMFSPEENAPPLEEEEQTPGAPLLLPPEMAPGERVPGTPRYMAPERWRHEPSTPATDMWSLGVILYELISGAHPYEGSDVAGLCARVLAPTATPVLPEGVEVPAELDEVVAACLQKEPEERPAAKEVAEALEGLLGRSPDRQVSDEEPFRGLLPFGERHAGLFFGREAEVGAFLERLREESVLPVVGPSGAGKSSFVQAGVVPRLREQGRWLVIQMRPGRDPFLALATRLSQEASRGGERVALPDPQGLAVELSSAPSLLPLTLQQLAEDSGDRVLLFVDQLEEVYTLVRDEGVRRDFMEAVCRAADDPLGPVRVIFTLRDDFLVRVAETAAAREALAHITVLRSPDPESLREILTRPLDRVGYRYEDGELPSDMIEAVAGERACLPLLQFACSQLWERRDREAKALTRSAYEAMGGVEGALVRHADEVLEGLSPPQVGLAREVLLRLITPEGTRRLVPRGQLLEGLADEAGHVLDRLVASRAVVVRKGSRQDAEAELELVHESLVQSWRRLSRWLDESREEVAFLAEVGQAAELWEKRGEKHEEVWSGDALQEALLRAARCAVLPAPVQRFLEMGRRREQRRVRRRRGAVVAIMVALALVAVVLLAMVRQGRIERARTEDQRAHAESQRSRADSQRLHAESQRAEAQREGALAAALRGDPFEARAKLRLSLEGRDTPLARALWWRLSQERLQWVKGLGSVVYDVAISPDGRTVAAGCQNRTVVLLDAETLSRRILRGHDDHVLAVAYSPDGGRLASATWSGELRVWDVAEGGHRALSEGGAAVRELSWSPDGTKLATACADDAVRLWDVAAGVVEKVLEGHDASVLGVAYGPGGGLVASGSGDGTVRLWDVETGETRRVLRGHDASVTRVTWSADGRLLASGSFDRTARLWDVSTGSERAVLRGHTAPVRGVSFSSDGDLLASGSYDGTIRLWDTDGGAEVDVLRGHAEQVREVAFARDGALLVSGGLDRTVRLWAVDRDGSLGGRPQGGRGGRGDGGLAFSPDGSLLATGGLDNAVQLWDVSTGRRARTLRGHDAWVMAVHFAPDGAHLASASHDGTVRIWRVEDGTEAMVLRGHSSPVRDVRVDPRGELVASAGTDRTVRIWDLRTGAEIHALRGHEQEIIGLAWAPDGRRLASTSYDGTVRLWDVASGDERGVLRGHEGCVWGVAFDPAGRRLATSGCDRSVRLWSLSRRGRAPELIGRHDGRVTSLDFHPTEERLVTPSADGTARIWDLRTSEWIPLRGHRDDVLFARWSPDGALVATTGPDGTVRLWDGADGRPLWRAPLLLPSPSPELLTHNGWIQLAGGDGPAPERARADWRGAVSERARLASVSGEADLCLLTFGGVLEHWDRQRDRLVATHPVSRAGQLISLPEGCLVLAEGRVLLFEAEGAPGELAEGATAVTWDSGEVFVATAAGVAVYAPDGRRLREHDADRDVTALTRVGSYLALGFQDGNLELAPAAADVSPRDFTFEQIVPSPVVSLAAGPESTLVVGYANGLLGLWSLESGARLHEVQLHGAVTHLVHGDRRIVAASELGDHVVVDVEVFYQNYCALLGEVWQSVPVVWSEGRPVPRDPPAPGEHECSSLDVSPRSPAGR